MRSLYRSVKLLKVGAAKASARGARSKCAVLRLGGSLLEGVCREVSEKTVERMVRIPLDLLDDVAHAGQNGWLGILINVALKKLEDVETIARILHKCRKQDVQAVVH